MSSALLRIAHSVRHRRPRLIGGFAVIVVALLAVPAIASADRGFTPRFSTNDTGDITIAANTLMTCPTAAANCTAGQAGAAQNNNNFNMGYVDVDGDSSTFDSSNSKLRLPSGATVLFAGLYWGADTSAGSGGTAARDASVAGRGTVLLKAPGASAYTTLGPTATVLDSGTGTSTNRYQAFLDVTSLVKAAGAGTYTVANVQAGTGADRYAGWSLVVAYRDTAMPPRNLTIFDGYKTISATEAPTSISLTGFTTPPAGAVKTTLGFVSYEGDNGLVGDTASLNGTKLSDALNPATNFFNSTISERGVDRGEREPNYANQYGFDADLVGADGILGNETSSATIGLTTSGDAYYPGVVTFATELYAPKIDSTNVVENVTHPGGPAQRGDTLRYTVTYKNNGQDGADVLFARDNIPTGTTYVPGSMQIATGPGAGAMTDAPNDDRAEYEAENRRVTFRLGAGATPTSGGRLAAGASSSFTFLVKVNSDVLDKTTITSQATARFFGQSLGTSLSNTSPVASVIVAAPDLTLTNSHEPDFVSGAKSISKLTVTNSGSLATDGSTVTVTDPFPGAAFDSIAVKSASGWTCAPPTGVELTCTRADALASGASYPPIEVEALVHDPAPASIANTARVEGGGDSDASNNTATDVGAGTGRADLQLTGTTPVSTVASGKTATFEFVVHNGGPSVAHGIVFEDPLGSDWKNAKASVAGGECTSAVRCTIGELASGAEVRIKVEATVVANAKKLTNTATVAATEPADPTTENNTAAVEITVPNTADLAVTANASPEHPRPGVTGGLTYTITVRNGGPGTAERVSVADTLPEQFELVSTSAPGFNCSLEPGNILSCTNPSLAVSEGTRTITIVGTVAANAGASQLFNAVRARAETLDPNGENNSASNVTVSAAASDLEEFVEGPAGRIAIGSPGTFKLTTKNNGPGDALPTKVVDVLPAGLEFVSASSDCSYDSGKREVTCAIGALASGASQVSELTVQPAPGTDGEVIENTASVTAPPSDPVPTNNSSTDSLLVVARADLSLTATLSPPNPKAGETATLTLTAKNSGPNAATGVTIVDHLPTGLEVVEPLPPTCTLKERTVTCTVVGLGSGGEGKIELQLVADPSLAGQTIVNEATIGGTSNDPNTADNTAKTEITVPAIEVPEAGGGGTGGDTGGGNGGTDNGNGNGNGGGNGNGNTGGNGGGNGTPSNPGTGAGKGKGNKEGKGGNEGKEGKGAESKGGRAGVHARSGLLRVKMVPNKRSVRAGGTFRYKITLRTVGKFSVNRIRVCTRIPRKLTLVGAKRAKITAHRRKVCWTVRKLGPNKRKRLILKVKANPTARHRVVAKARVRAAGMPKKTIRAKRVKLIVGGVAQR
jgi:uncharacterized repeat protein (TIGR01451 family)